MKKVSNKTLSQKAQRSKKGDSIDRDKLLETNQVTFSRRHKRDGCSGGGGGTNSPIGVAGIRG